MLKIHTLLAIGLLSLLAMVVPAAAQDDRGGVREWTVDGVKREALVFPPGKKTDAPAPVVLVFHGHGGTMGNMARKGFQRLWPEAIFVFPQGLPTVVPNDPEGKRSGWQMWRGVNDDRDLIFFDAMLKTLRETYRVDDKRVYATGHSNGGGFTYLLWGARGERLAAVAPSGAGSRATRVFPGVGLKPLPVLHVAGETDEIVPFANQQRTMEAVKKINGCDAKGEPWATAGDLVGTLYPSKGGTPFVSVIYAGGHKFPDETPELIVKFFKEHAKE